MRKSTCIGSMCLLTDQGDERKSGQGGPACGDKQIDSLRKREIKLKVNKMKCRKD